MGGQSYTLENALSMTVQSNNVREPARFSCEASVEPQTGNTLSAQATIEVEITATVQGGTPTTLIFGLVDSIEYTPIDGRMVLSGRDLSGLLVDAPTEQTYANLTSSEIVQQFVNQYSSYGMQGNITATTKPVGRFYGIDYGFTLFGQFYRATTQWDLVLFLAQMEGFDVHMDGKTLYFGPPTAADQQVYELAMGFGPPVVSNAEFLRLTRSLTLAKDVQVTVLSWNSMLLRPIKRVVKSSNSNAPKGGYGPAQKYVFYKPDLTPDQALQYGYTKLNEITKLERVVETKIPGELKLTPASKVRLVGTQSTWDQDYFVQEIDRSISFQSGFSETLRLKNVSPANQSTVE